MSNNTPYLRDSLRSAALKRAAKQFPELDPEEVVATVEQQHSELVRKCPVVDVPMRDLRNS